MQWDEFKARLREAGMVDALVVTWSRRGWTVEAQGRVADFAFPWLEGADGRKRRYATLGAAVLACQAAGWRDAVTVYTSAYVADQKAAIAAAEAARRRVLARSGEARR